MSLSFLSRRPAGLLLVSPAGLRNVAHYLSAPATTELLEQRLAMTAMTPTIQMLSATTTDSKSITIDYQVNQVPSSTDPDTDWDLSFQQRSVRLERFTGRHRYAGRAWHGRRDKAVSHSIKMVSPPSPLVPMS